MQEKMGIMEVVMKNKNYHLLVVFLPYICSDLCNESFVTKPHWYIAHIIPGANRGCKHGKDVSY